MLRSAARRARDTLVGRPVVRVPRDPRSVPDTAHSPHLRFDTATAVVAERIQAQAKSRRRGRFLDVGGGAGHHRAFAGPLDYWVLDLENMGHPQTLIGDICGCPHVEDGSFDVVFSHNTFEHLAEPWLAAAEIGRILAPGGIAAVVTCFGWRYHPVPGDYWRYTHSALELIFEKHGGLTTVDSGYDLQHRRDGRNDKLPGHLDLAPEDSFGGWLENWAVYYVGRKPTDAAAARPASDAR